MNRQEISEPTSSVHIENLQIPPVTAPDVWGRAKLQPAVLSLSVYLRTAFTDHAGADNLSTSVNYGLLSKRIRALDSLQAATVGGVFTQVKDAVRQEGRKPDGSSVAESGTIELRLPKASTTGDAFIFSQTFRYHDDDSPALQRASLSIPGMQLMALIGINDFERMAKQRIVASLSLDYFDLQVNLGHKVFLIDEAGDLERYVVKIIENSDFETLEALASCVTRRVGEKFSELGYGNATIKMRLEKPKAIAFADAAVVEHVFPASAALGSKDSQSDADRPCSWDD